MVAIVSGNGLGLLNTSGNILGQNGLFGNAASGASKEGVYVNVGNGNLMLQDQDDYLAANGIDLALSRTYNSQGTSTDGVGAQWKLGVSKQVSALTGTINTTGSTLTRIDGDGTAQKYTYDSTRKAYISNDGAGAYQSIVQGADGNWIWRDSRSDLAGLQETYNFTSGRITSVGDEAGVRLSYQYDGNGQLAQIVDASGDVTTFGFQNGLLSQVSTGTLVRTSYAYDALGRLIGTTVDLTPANKTDNAWYTTTYAYDGASNRIASMTQSDGTSLNFTYVSSGGVMKVATVSQTVAGVVRTTSYDYSVAGQTSVRDPLGNVTVYGYDASAQLTKVTEAPVAGVASTTTFVYDAKGNVLSVVAPNGTTTATYDAYGNQIKVTDALGNTITRTFDTTANLALTETVTSSAGVVTSTTRYAYDTSHHLRFTVSGEGRVTEYRYNANGQRTDAIAYTKATLPLTTYTTTTAPTEATLTTWAAANAANASVTEYTYDARGLIAAQTTYTRVDASGARGGGAAVTLYTYDQAGQLLSQSDPASNVTRFTYDGLGRVLTSTDANGNTTTNSYDDAHNTLRTTLASGLVTTAVYDAAGELLLLSRTSADGIALGSTRYTYDADGRLCMTTDPVGTRTFALYDEDGRRAADIDGDGTLTQYFYETSDHVTRTIRYASRVDTATLVDASGNYLFKSLGTILPAAANTDNRSSWNIYDKLGRLTDTVDGEGYLTHRDYDALGNLIQVTQRATAISTATLASTNQPTAFTQPAASADDRVTRSIYDKDGNLVGILDAEGFLTERRYDGAGRLLEAIQYTTAKTVATTTPPTLATARPVANAADVHTHYIYDSNDRLVGTVDGKGYLTENVYTPDGNVASTIIYGTPIATAVADTATIDTLRPSATSPDDRNVAYQYDAIGKLTREIASDGTVTSYVYDKLGKLTATTVTRASDPQSGTQYRYDSLGNLTATLPPIGVAALANTDSATVWARYATTYTYDASGDRISMTDPNGNRTLYYYDNDSRLAYSIDALGDVTRTVYNAFGQAASTTRYANRVAAAVLAGLRGGDAETSSATIDALASAADSVTTYAYDHDGNLTDQADALKYHTISKYDAFGEVTGVSQPGTANSTATDMTVDGYSRVFYDRDGRVAATLSGTGSVTAYQYDGNGNVTDKIAYAKLVAVTDIATVTKATLLLRVVADPVHDAHEHYVYDARGLLAATFTAVSYNPAYSYDANGLAVGMQQWSVSTNTYDASGNLTTQTAAVNMLYANAAGLTAATAVSANNNDRMVRYYYDGLNRLTATATAQRVGANGREWTVATREYDAAGNVVAQTTLGADLSAAAPTAADIAGFAGANRGPSDQTTRYAYDAGNRLVASAVAQGADNGILQWSLTTYTYDNAGNVIAQTQLATKLGSSADAAALSQAGWRQWLMAGTATKSPLDRTTRFGYDALNRQAVTIDAAGAVTARVFDSKGNVVKTSAYATLATFSGPVPANYAPATGGADRVTRMVYDADNRPIYTIDGLGDVTEYRYDARDNVVKTIAYATPLDVNKLPTQPAAADVKPATSAGDRVERRVYDQAGQLRYVTDAAGYVTETQYDGAGLVVKSIAWDYAPTVAEGASVSTWTTALSGKPSRTKTYAYDATGNLLTLTDVDSKTETYTYDGVGNKLTFKNKAGSIWTYQYDAAGRMIQESSPVVTTYPDAPYAGGASANTYKATSASIVTRLSYDAFGNISARTEAAGTAQERTTRYFYDDVGHQVKTVLPSVAVYDGSADPASNIMSGRYEKDSGELSVVVTYDAFGDAIANKDVGGNVSEKAYDARGNVVYERDALGGLTEYQRNTFGDIAKLVRHAVAFTGSMTSRLTDPNATIGTNSDQDRAIVYSYDVLGRQTRSVETASYIYDPNIGQSTQVLAARTVDTDYDGWGDVIASSVYGADASGAKITGAATIRSYYDARGNKTAQLSVVREAAGGQPATGYLTTYAYNEADRLSTQVEYANAVALYGDVRDRTTYAPATTSLQDRKTAYTYDALGQMLTETHTDATYVDGATGKTATTTTAVTTYTYDAVGNQISATDALGGAISTRYDVLGRVTAVKKSQPTTGSGVTTASSPLTEFKLDVYGNVVLRIDYAQGAANVTVGDFTALSTTDVNNRMTATTYDLDGHATQVVRGVETGGDITPTLTYTYTSYDAFGRAAKQWSTYTDVQSGNLQRNTFTITNYDAAGHVASTTTPANLDNVNMVDRNWQSVTVSNVYNLFGELTQRNLKDATGNLSTIEQTSYDQAGHAWRSNSGDGVTKVTTFDIQGDATSVIRSAAVGANPLDGLASVASVFSLNNLLRTDTSYDLLGHATGISTVTDVSMLRHDAQSGTWSEVQSGFQQTDLVIISRPEDGTKSITVKYRLKGNSDWITASADRVRTVQGYGTFSTAGLAGGSYEFQVMSQGAGEAAYISAGGSVDVAAASSNAEDAAVIRLYAVLFKRAPTPVEINQAVARMNDGASLAQLALSMLDSTEGKAYLGGTAPAIMAKIFSDAFGRTGAAADASYAADLTAWTNRFQQVDSVAGDSRGQAIVDLIDQTLASTSTNTFLTDARTRLQNRATVETAYLIDNRGADAATAARLFAAADTATTNHTSIDPVKADATSTAFQEGLRQQVAQLYVILLGRAPDPASMAYWYGYSLQTGSVTIDDVATWTLNSAEATSDPSLYPTANLTPAQYLQQLVTHAYQNMLGRQPTAAELSGWLGALNGTNGAPAISKAQFVLQLADQVASYKGTDATRLQEKAQFNNRVAVAYAISGLKDANGNPLPVDGAATRLIINAVGADATVAAAAASAVAALGTAAKFAGTVSGASASIIASTQVEATRYQIARLYTAVFNRAPDTLGMAFYMAKPPVTEADWITFATNLLNSTEATQDGTLVSVKNVNGTLVPRSNTEFIQRVYEQALGQSPLQPTTGMIAEMSALVQRLNNGEARGRVLLSALNGILGYAGLTPAEQAIKDTFDNRAAVGVALATDIGFTSVQVGRNSLAMVTATDIQSALNYAYLQNQPTLAATLGANAGAATSAGSAMDAQAAALSSQLVAQSGVQSATNMLNGVANAAGLFSLVQVYVGLLGRTPDVAGIKYYFDALNRGTLAQNIKALYDSVEVSGATGRYPPSDSNDVFVAKVYASIFGLNLKAPPAASSWSGGSNWVQQLNTGVPRDQVWSGILSSVIAYTNNQPDAAATQFLKYKQTFSENVSAALLSLDYASQADIAPVKQTDDAMHTQLTALLNTMNAAANTRAAALSTASSQLAAANSAGDGLADYRLKLTLLYATVLQRTKPPTFDEMNYWSDRNVPLADVAQNMITSTDPGAVSYAGADNTTFVKLMFQRILHRDVTDAASISYYVNQLNVGTTRGFVATDILKNYIAYSDNTAALLTNKAGFDGTLDQMLALESTSAAALQASAYTVWSTNLATSNQAQADYNTAVGAQNTALNAMNTAASAAVDAHTIQTYAANQQAVTYIYMGLRGYTDIGGVAFWMKNYSPDTLINSLLPVGGTSTSFVSALYTSIQGRTGSASEMSYWINLIDTGGDTRLNVAKNILYSAEATARLNPITAAAMKADTATVNSRIAAESATTTAYTTALTATSTKYTTWQRVLTTTNTSKIAYDKATAVAVSASALASAHTYVTTADTKYAAAAKAQDDYNTYKVTVDAEDVQLNALKPYDDATFAALLAATNTASAAKASVDLAAAVALDSGLTVTARQVRQVAQLYTTVVGAPPTLSALNYWTTKLAAGASLVDIAGNLMSGPEAIASNLYAAGMSNTAFVVQLFRFAVGRDVSNEPISLSYWGDQLTGPNALSRAQLAASFIQSLMGTGNSDSLAFERRVSQTLSALGSAATTLKNATGAAPVGVSLADYATAFTTAQGDAAGRAAVAANPQANNVNRAARLYIAIMDRSPDAAGLVFWENSMSVLAVGGDGGDATIAKEMLLSKEATALYPASMDNATFGTLIAGRVLGRAPTSSELASYAGMTRGAIVANVLSTAAAPDPSMLQQESALLFNGKVDAALAALQPDMAKYIDRSAAALSLGQLAQAANPVDKHMEQVTPGVNTLVQSGKLGTPMTTYTVDRWGNVLSMTDPRDANWVTTYTYNGTNELLSTATPFALTNGVVSDTSLASTGYDKLGRAVTTTDGRGFINTTKYDSNGNVVSEVHADGGIVASTYDLFGERLSVTQPGTSAVAGVKTLYAYDHFGNLSSVTTGASIAVYQIDNVASGTPNLTVTTLSSRQLVDTYYYDELGRRIKTVNAAGETSTKQYDTYGNVIAETDALGHTSYSTYDPFGHLVAQVDAMGTHRQTWNVDSQGRITSQTNYDKQADGTWTASFAIIYTYDDAGRLVNQTSSQYQNITYTYVGEQLRTIDDDGTGQLTSYAYDRAGNRVREKTVYDATNQSNPGRIQNNTSTYDLQNRLASVKDDVYTLTFTYDKNGNRTDTRTAYGQTAFDAYNTYDSMNRQLMVNGVLAADGKTVVLGALGSSSHQLTYDLAGNRMTDTYAGAKLSYSNGSWTATSNSVTTETYSYDAVGRLATVSRDGMRIDTRYYDAAGRVLESGMIPGTLAIGNTDNFAKAVKNAGLTSEFRMYAYDADGHVIRQVTRAAVDSALKGDVYLVHDKWNPVGGYDADGNLTGYTAIDIGHGGAKIKYMINYQFINGAQETSTSVVTEGGTNTTFSSYDHNLNRYLIVEGSNQTTQLWYDANGQVLQKSDAGTPSFSLIVNGQVLGVETQTNDNVLGTTYTSLSEDTLATAPSFYTVQVTGEKLTDIARVLWGDSNLWYLIGDANGLTLQDTLPAGQTLRIPERATVVHNSADTFKPYNASAAIGDTTPLPVPSKADGGCGAVGQVFSVAIAIAVTVALSGAGSVLSSTMASLFSNATAAEVATSAVAAAAGSAASQTFNIATGMQSSFNWGAVATSALMGGVTEGVSSAINGAGSLSTLKLSGWQGAAVNATISNAAAQGIGIITGLQNGFDWRSVAAAGASAAASAAMGGKISKPGTFADTFATRLAGDTAYAVARGGRISLTQIVTDAFGNALGSSLADMAASRASSAPASGNINVSALRAQAEQYDFNRAYPQASLTADAYAQRDQFEASGFIPSNELPQMSVPGAPLGAFMNDGGNPQGLNYDPSKPYVIVYGQKLSKDQWTAIDRYEAGQTAAEFGAGIGDGIKSLPGGVWNGIKTVGDGYRGLAYLLSGNIDSFQPRSNVTLDSIGRSIYHSSPLGIVGSLMEGRYRQAGSDTVGTAVGFATTKFAPELNKIPGLNSDVGAMSKTALLSLGETASTRIENYLNDQGLILYAVPPAKQVAINKAAGDAWELDVMQNVLPTTQVNIQPQITIRSNGPSGLRVRLDALGEDTTSGATALSDMKASQTAPFTPNQAIVYPELAQFGGVVVGKGKAPFIGGTQILPTVVDIFRKK